MRTKRGLQKKLIACFVIFSLLLAAGIGIFSYFNTLHDYTQYYTAALLRTVRLAANKIDGDDIEYYYKTREIDAAYDGLKRELDEMKQSSGLFYLYVFVPDKEYLTYIIEGQTPEDNPALIAKLGDIYNYGPAEYEYLVPDIIAQKGSDTAYHSSAESAAEFGDALMAWVPIFNSKGDMVAMIEGDCLITDVIQTTNAAVLPLILITVLIIITGAAALLIITKRIIVKPLNLITGAVTQFASGDSLSYNARLETNDELETLNAAFLKLSGDITEYTRRIASIAAVEERVAAEAKLLGSIEESVLSEHTREHEYFLFSGALDKTKSYEPGRAFYDCFASEDRAYFCVVEISGAQGITGILYMIIVKTMIRSILAEPGTLSQRVNKLNSQIIENRSGKFTVSALLCEILLDTGEMNYLAADYSPPYVKNGLSEFTRMPEAVSQPLGLARDVSFAHASCRLMDGDCVLAISRGMLAAELNGRAFAEQRLPALMRGFVNMPPEQMLGAIVAAGHDSENVTDSPLALAGIKYTGAGRRVSELILPARPEGFSMITQQLKKQFSVNKISGGSYAQFAVALEELFVLCVSRVQAGSSIKMQSIVIGASVLVSLSYSSQLTNPLIPETAREHSALNVISRYGGEIGYAAVNGMNVVTLKRDFGAQTDVS